jgi:dCMP deaminase
MTWTTRFLSLAEHIAGWSRDPSTQVGAVIVRPDKTVVSLGFNGFPRGIADDHRLNDRALKYEMIVHAEENALLMSHQSVRGCDLYTWPMPPCSRCAAKIIQAGISRVVSPPAGERWESNTRFACDLLNEAGVVVEVVS